MNNGTFREMGTRPWSFKVLYFMATSLPFVTNASVWTGQMVSLPTNTVVMGNFVCCQTWPRGPDSTLCLDVSVKVLLADDVIGNGGPGQAEALSRVFSRAVQRQHGGSKDLFLPSLLLKPGHHFLIPARDQGLVSQGSQVHTRMASVPASPVADRRSQDFLVSMVLCSLTTQSEAWGLNTVWFLTELTGRMAVHQQNKLLMPRDAENPHADSHCTVALCLDIYLYILSG